MKKETIKYFSCSKCRGNLSIDWKEEDVHHERIKNGSLRCLSCNKEFPIINYIPRFVDRKNYCDSFGFQWNHHKKIQIDRYNGYNFSSDRLFHVSQWPKDLRSDLVLEVGSGAGRFTQILVETGAQVFSFDLSTSVNVNLENSRFASTLHLFQADMQQIPLHHGLFDKIICLGVLQHTPDPEKSFKALLPFLKSSGQIVIDIYKKTLISILHWKYLLRPVLKKIKKEKLYYYTSRIVPILLPVSIAFRKIGGSFGARLIPIANYSYLGIPYSMNKEFSILDTFDMFSPEFDKPQTLSQVNRWFEDCGLQDVHVQYGYNGIIGRGTKK